jgi:hypothetical protein
VHLALPAFASSAPGAQAVAADAFVLELPTGVHVLLTSHNDDSLALLASSHPGAAGLSSTSFSVSHFVDVYALSGSAPGVLRVLRQHAANAPVKASLHLTALSLPATARMTDHRMHVESLRTQMGLPTIAKGGMASAFHSASSSDIVVTPYSTAISIVYHHPELMTLDAAQAAIVKAHIEASPLLEALSTAIANQPDTSIEGPAWCKTVLVTDDDTGEPLLFTDGSHVYDHQVSDEIMALAGLVMEDALRTVKADLTLQDKTWSISDGVASRTLQPPALMASAGGYDISPSIANGQRMAGVTFNCEVVDRDRRLVKVVVQNSYVRTLGVYVEFIDVEGRSLVMTEEIRKSALTSSVYISPDDMDRVSPGLKLLVLPQQSALLGMQGPTSGFMGIPTFESYNSHLIMLPEAASGFRIKMGTMGYDTFWSSNGGAEGSLTPWHYAFGLFATVLFEMTLPIYFLASGVGMKSDGWRNDLKNDAGFMSGLVTDLLSITIEGEILFSTTASQIEKDRAWERFMHQWPRILVLFGDRISKFLLKKGGAKLAAYLAVEMTASQLLGALAFVGWALRAASVISTAARLGQTLAESFSNTAAIVNTVQVCVDLQLVINPDLDDSQLPVAAKFYQIQVQKGKTTFYKTDWIPVQGENNVTMTLRKVASGGVAKVFVIFCDKPNGKLLGKGMAATYLVTSDAIALLKKGNESYKAVPPAMADKLGVLIGNKYTTTQALATDLKTHLGVADSNTYRKSIVGMLADVNISLLLAGTAPVIDIECTIEEQLIPLTSSTRYQHDQILACVGERYQWNKTPTPPTLAGGGLLPFEPVGITLAQRSAQLGYTWRTLHSALPVCGFGDPSPQSFTAQNISSSNDPNVALRRLTQRGVACGVTEGVGLLYQLMGETDGNGENFLLEGSLGALHVRPIPINNAMESSLSLDVRRPSYGTFHRMPTAVVWHPGKYLVGVHASLHKIEVLDLSNGIVMDDALAPSAQLFGGLGMRPGLMRGPTCVASTLSGAVLVLEAMAHRVQAFDIHGSPIPLFQTGTQPEAYFSLTRHYSGDVTYLDMGVEATGYVYVLCYTGTGQNETDYYLDIYSPLGKHVCATNGFVAGKMVVNLWRTVYTLNKQFLVGPGGRKEPTVSRWIPTEMSPR